MAEAKRMTFPFINRGLVQRIKPSLLQAGQYSVLQNMTSEQEGAVETVKGSKKLGAGSVGSLYHSMASLDLGETKARYVGAGSSVFRGSEWSSLSASPVASAVGASGDRWSHVEYFSGSSGKPWLYIAAPYKTLRDDGSKASLYEAGLKPPIIPVTVEPAGATVIIAADWETDTVVGATGGTKSTETRFSTTVASVSGSGPYYTLTLNSTDGLLPGMLVKVGSEWVVVDKVESGNKMKAFFSGTPSAGQSVTDNAVKLTIASAGQASLTVTPTNGDLSLGGLEKDAFDSPDIIHVSIWVSDATKITDLRIQFDVSSTPASFVDYYEKAIVPSRSTEAITAEQQVENIAAERQRLIDEFGLDIDDFTYWEDLELETQIDEAQRGIRPLELSPLSSGQWTELNVPKSQFLKVGAAGSGIHNWSNVNRVRLVVNASEAVDVKISSTYGVGGKNPKAARYPYDYRYTYYDPETGAESNPSVEMISRYRISPWRQAVSVTVTGTDDPKVPTTGNQTSIRIYRRGGSLPDQYRLVGQVTNPGLGSTVRFTDNAADAEIVGAKLLEFDNDPPVTSRLPVALTAQIASLNNEGGLGSGGAEKVNRINLTGLPSGFGNVKDSITPGSRVIVGSGATREVAYVKSVPTDNSAWIECYLQYAHQPYANDPSETVEISSASGVACDLIAQVGDSLFLAGDPNNPHYLYQSKPGGPDSWPVEMDETGVVHQIPVGNPSNPIHGITEFQGGVLCMCQRSLYLVKVWQGAMQKPQELPYPHGLVAKHAWTKADQTIWYLSSDGIYEIRGYQPVKRSEPINFIFTGQTVGGIAPLDFSQAEKVHFSYINHIVIILYPTASGDMVELRYETLYDRWHIRKHKDPGGSVTATAFHVERDDNKLYVAKSVTSTSTSAYVYEHDTGSSDGWTTIPTDGAAIDFEIFPPPLDMGDPYIEKLFAEVSFEIENEGSSTATVTVETYYDNSSTPDAGDTFTINVAGNSRDYYPLPLTTGLGRQANVIAFKIKGSVTVPVVLHSMTVAFYPIADIQKGRTYDWDDLGYPYDKRLYQVTFVFETEGQDVQLVLDTIEGVEGVTKQVNRDGYTVNSPSGTRGIRTFPVADGIIAKMVKIRPSTAANYFKLLGYHFQFEKYPPDIVSFTEWEDGGTPQEKYVQQLSIDVDTGGVAATVKVQADGGDVQTLTVTTTSGDRRRNLTLNKAIKGRKFRLLNTPGTGAGAKFQLFSHWFKFLPADRGPVEHTHDWDTLNWPYDKHLKTITFEYDNSGGTVQVTVDTITGINGTTENIGAFTFTLSGTGRSVQTFNFPADTFVKAIRVQPVSTTTSFQLWGYKVSADNYPPDIVSFTEWEDGGVPYYKYAQEVALTVDTGGVAATVKVQADGGDQQTFTITSTSTDRERIVTLNPAMKGKRFRLLNSPGPTGKFQLFNHRFTYLGADPGQVRHSYDWDDLEWPFDKELRSITVHYDNSGGTIQLLIDTLTGIDGTTQNLSAFTFTLSGTGRSIQTFNFPENTIVKAIRVRPASTTTDFQMWKYQIDKTNYPPDVIEATQDTDLGWPCEKILRAVVLKVDTGGVDATVKIEADGTVAHSATVNSTNLDRTRIISPVPNIIASRFRILADPGTGGKFQLFDVDYQAIKEPCALTEWDSYEQIFGYAGYKFLKQVWVEYHCEGGIRISIYRDGKQLLHQVDLPAHSERSTERFFIPVRNGTVLNKSISYRFHLKAIDSSKPFKFYRDGSRVETMILSGDQHAAYQQHLLWQNMDKPV